MNRSSYTRATEKNRRRIQEAFAELLAERGSITNITVTDLAERAEITRGTFYNYYNEQYLYHVFYYLYQLYHHELE